MTSDEDVERKKRQRSRNMVLGGLLLFMVVLFYMITIARMGSS
jgi:hypothetical protein